MPQITLKTAFHTLKKSYKPPRTFLNYTTPFQLLVATLLSAQCTDAMVNKVTQELFKKYPGPKDFTKLTQAKLEKEIHSTGFFRTKAKHVLALSHILIQKYSSEVPRTMDELTALPGIGRKTACIILYAAFGKSEGIAVDTHVLRLARRLGLTKQSDPKRVEQDLMKALPRTHWGELTPLMISHGRAVCVARNRRCSACLFQQDCPSSLVMRKKDRAKR
ncbi:MAG TPA: endonuclease III [Candidatus Peribacterales bacterium]|nr:endonuclease III [Candidatus Peribacterales bacterium]